MYFLSQKSWYSPSVCSSAGERTASVGECSETVPHDVPCESEEGEKERDEIPAEPELPGLLSQECDLHKVKAVLSFLKNGEKIEADMCICPIVTLKSIMFWNYSWKCQNGLGKFCFPL